MELLTTSPQTRLEELAGQGTLMTVWAHPDDESFCGAGLMMAAADAGRPVINVSATLGELGTADPARWTPERLGRRRRLELDRALSHLGGADVELLGIRDGSCELLDDRLGARLVAAAIERHQPDLILTFGPDGVTGHPDHQAVNRWTAQAAAMVEPDLPVLNSVTAQAWPEDLIDPLDDIGAFFPGYPQQIGDRSDVAVNVSGTRLDRKLQALESHESQIGPLRDRLGQQDFRRLFGYEAYRPANPAAELAIGPQATARPLAAIAA